LGSTPTNLLADILAAVDLTSRQLKVDLVAIDSSTGEMPLDPTIGLLRPNDPTHRGEGYITYSIEPLAGAQSGTVITNRATIVFDNSEPMETAPVWNTIDGAAPTSAVAVLQAAVPPDFPVSWSGSDDPGGSGVQGYDIYVRDGNGPYQLWLGNTPASGAVYPGEPGHTYAFFSLGRDNAGNLGTPPAIPDTITMVMSNSAPVLEPIPDFTINVGQILIFTNVAHDPDVPPQTLTFGLLPGAPPEVRLNPTNGIVSWRPSFAYGSTTNPIGISVCDNGTPSLCATQSFKVMVTDILVTELDAKPVPVGGSDCVPLTLFASTPVTNLDFAVAFPPARLTNFDLIVRTEVGTGFKYGETISNALFGVFSPAGQVLFSNVDVGLLCFTVTSNQPSSFLPLVIGDVQGRRPDGTTVTNISVLPGRVAVVGEEPLLEAIRNTNNQPLLVLYGMIDTNYAVLSSTALESLPGWQTNWQGALTEYSKRIEPAGATNRIMFFRARREP